MTGAVDLAGDVRANENIELTAVQTLFMREHNRIAGLIQNANPSMGDEDIYQNARAMVSHLLADFLHEAGNDSPAAEVPPM